MMLCNSLPSSSFTSTVAIAAKSSSIPVTHNFLVHSDVVQFNLCSGASSNLWCFPLTEQRRRHREANQKRWGSLQLSPRIRCSLNGKIIATQQLVPSDFIVVNFYRFVFIGDPQLEVSTHLDFVKDLDLHGRIYLNEQGINAQYSGPTKDALAYVEWLRNDSRFSDLLVQISPAFSGHAFPKLRLRYKPSLVQMEGGSSHLPLLDPSMRAEPLTPSEWRQRLEAISDRNHVLLDVRNGTYRDLQVGSFSLTNGKLPDNWLRFFCLLS